MTLSFGRRHFEDGSRDTIHRNHGMRPNTHVRFIMSRYHIITLLTTLPTGWHHWSGDTWCLDEMHEGWKSSMVAVEGNHFIVQSMCSSMMMTITIKKRLQSMSKVQSSWRRLGDEKRCWREGFHGNDSQDVFPLDIDGYFYDSFSYDLTDVLSWLTHLILAQWLNSFVTLFPHISYHSHDESNDLSIVIHFYSYDSFSCVASSFFHGCTIVLTEAARHDSFLTHFWLTSFSMLVEYSGNNIVITSSA